MHFAFIVFEHKLVCRMKALNMMEEDFIEEGPMKESKYYWEKLPFNSIRLYLESLVNNGNANASKK